MTIHLVSPEERSQYNFLHFGKTIYHNFKELAEHPSLKHSLQEIMRVIKSSQSAMIFKLHNKKIIGYALGEIMNLNDGRNVFYITYIYTAMQFRSRGIASELIDAISNIVNKSRLDGILLTCDSEDPKIMTFYENRGFMPDLVLRTYSKYEVLFK